MKETAEERSRIMRAVKSRDTSPELIVRRLLHLMGYRFRVHRTDLPGKPDIILPGLQKVLFVHGCFWHGHNCPRGDRVPKENRDYWTAKITRNKERDKRVRSELRKLGWRSLAIWECELKDMSDVCANIKRFLEGKMK